jgi:hypothetical protein
MAIVLHANAISDRALMAITRRASEQLAQDFSGPQLQPWHA